MKLAGALVALVMLDAGCRPAPAAPRPPEFDRDAVPAASAASAGATFEVGDGLVLPEERHAVGDRVTIVDEMSILTRVEADGVEPIRYDTRADRETTVEVLGVDARGEITRERVTFVVDEVRSILGREVQRVTSPVAGKTYVITHDAGAVAIVDDRGRTPPRSELAALGGWTSDTTPDAVLDRIYAGRRWRFGERIQLGAAALAEVNRTLRDGGTRFTSYAMELRAVEGGVATFAVTVGLDRTTESIRMTLQLTGTREIDVASGRMLRLRIRGPVRGHLGAPIVGESTMEQRRR